MASAYDPAPVMLGRALAGALEDAEIERGSDCWRALVPPAGVARCLSLLRDAPDLLFQQLTDITAIDRPGRARRYTLVYHLLSMHHNARLRLKTRVGEGEAVPSASRLHPCADWLEREVWDMFGIPFSGHPDLRRILTDYGFEGHPLRKDFPLTGHVEVRWDEARRQVVREPVHLAQAFRDFDFESPWEEMAALFGPGAGGRPGGGAR